MKKNIFPIDHKVKLHEREQLNNHKSCVVWLTGLSSSGKSTLAMATESELTQQGFHAFVLDGDNIRNGLCSDLGFSVSDRTENIRRIAEVAKLFMQAGVITITAFISPFSKDRLIAKQIIGRDSFFEIYCDSSLSICEKRDPKGLYQKARDDLIPEFTGITSPYEAPTNPTLTLDTEHNSIKECKNNIIQLLQDKSIINVKSLSP